jgi:prepilin peptidase CpaA
MNSVPLNSIAWWPTASLVLIAAALDVRSRRIPNWLVVPFLAAGMAFAVERQGLAGMWKSVGGIGLAAAVVGVLCGLRGMGMGDLKLCAAVGAWIGFRQLGLALVIAAMAGGAMAVCWAVRHGAMGESFDGAGDLVFGIRQRGFRPHPALAVDNPRAHKMPFAPAIAIGTLFSFFC